MFQYPMTAYADPQTENSAAQVALYIIRQLAKAWNVTVQEAYQRLMNVDALENYFFRFYDTIHTQGTDYIIDDMTDYVIRREENPDAR